MSFLSSLGKAIAGAFTGGSVGGPWGAVAGAATSLGGTLLTNKTNTNNVNNTNAQNYQIWQEQKQFAEDMWNKNNEYNSASNQVQRLLDAGLNPALIMQGSGSSAAGGSTLLNAPQAPQMQSAQVSDTGFQTAGQILDNYFTNKGLRDAEVKKAQADAESASTDAFVKRLLAPYQLAVLNSTDDFNTANAAYLRSQRRMQDFHNGLTANNLDALNERYGLENQALHNQIQNQVADYTLKAIEAETQRIGLKYLPQQIKVGLALTMAQTKATTQQGFMFAANGYLAQAQKKGVDLDNYQTKRLAKYVASEAYYKNRSLQQQDRTTAVFDGPISNGWFKLLNTILTPAKNVFGDGIFRLGK